MVTNFDKEFILKEAVSPYDEFCEGYGNMGSSGNSYILGVVLSVAKVEKRFSHKGSSLLDEINAFDQAEVSDTFLGQINMSTVSSFCGPQGLILGYDLFPETQVLQESNVFEEIDGNTIVYHIEPLLIATKKLFGTVSDKRFPLRPGAHVPCAGKSIKVNGPGIGYSAIAIGIPSDRSKNACLLMEDVGVIPEYYWNDVEYYRKFELRNISRSIIQIGNNQKVKYETILTGVRFLKAEQGEIVCALVAAPYFTIAKKAVNLEKIKSNF